MLMVNCTVWKISRQSYAIRTGRGIAVVFCIGKVATRPSYAQAYVETVLIYFTIAVDIFIEEMGRPRFTKKDSKYGTNAGCDIEQMARLKYTRMVAYTGILMASFRAMRCCYVKMIPNSHF